MANLPLFKSNSDHILGTGSCSLFGDQKCIGSVNVWEVSPAPPTFPEVPLYIIWQDIVGGCVVYMGGFSSSPDLSGSTVHYMAGHRWWMCSLHGRFLLLPPPFQRFHCTLYGRTSLVDV